jgi:DNA-binding PadR family transcriptional regulator
MAKIVVITTAATPESGDARIQGARDIIVARGGRVVHTALPLRGTTPTRMRLLNELMVLALWALYYNGTVISARSLKSRLNVNHQTLSRLLATLTSEGWIESADRDWREGGRPPQTYRLTDAGLMRARLWFTRITQGARIVAEFNSPQQAGVAARRLSAQQGIIVPALETQHLVPYEIESLVLVACWILSHDGVPVNAPALRDRMLNDPSSFNRAFDALVAAGLLRSTGGSRTHYFAVTDRGDALARRYLGTLLG